MQGCPFVEWKALGSSLGLNNSRRDLFNPISELLILGDLQAIVRQFQLTAA
jgi:hypothetical protein